MRVVLGVTVAVVIVGLPLWHARQREKHQRAFRVVEPGVLYRSGQLSQSGLERVIREHGIRTVISLRFAARDNPLPPDAAEEEWCRSQGIAYHRIRPREWSAPDGSVPAEAGVQQFLDIMDDSTKHPVLIHCFAGVHRTGSHCAIFRMQYQGWSSEAALREMYRLGYDHLDDEADVREYVRNYRPRTVSGDRPGE